MTYCKTQAFINIPELGEFSEQEICYSDSISQLIEKILQSYQQPYSESFHLYVVDKTYTELNPQSRCSIMIGIKSNQLLLTKTQYRNITIYFESHRLVVPYDVSSKVIDFIDNVVHALLAESYLNPAEINETFVLFDPKSDSILFTDRSLNENSDFYILKRFEYIAPGLTFDVHKDNPVFSKSRITDCSLEQSLISHLIRGFRSFHKMLNFTEISFKKLTDQNIQEIFNDLNQGKYDSSNYEYSDQLNFIFSLFSLVRRPFIPSSLMNLVHQAVDTNNDSERFEIMQVICLYLPLSTILILEEILQIFGTTTVDAESWNTIQSMVDQLLFNSVSEDESENNGEAQSESYQADPYPVPDAECRKVFTSFLFLFLKQILFIKEKVGWKSQIKILKSQIPHKSHCKRRHHKHHKRRKGKSRNTDEQSKKSKDDEIDNDTDNDEEIENQNESKSPIPDSSDDETKSKKRESTIVETSGSDGFLTDDYENISASEPETENIVKEKKPIQFALLQEYNTNMVFRKIDHICTDDIDLYDDYQPFYRLETSNILLDKYLDEKSNKETQQQVGEDIRNLNMMLNELTTRFNISLDDLEPNISSYSYSTASSMTTTTSDSE